MDAFLVSTGLVALAEIGDKTQLLALLLAARYRQNSTIILGILCATLLNHAGAAALGTWITDYIGYDRLRWILGASFMIMAIWILIPDRQDGFAAGTPRLGVFGATFVAFFLAEMGDKTQLATVALAAQYTAFYTVVAGTTLGMMIANIPAVLFGEHLTRRIPARLIHRVAALVFAGLGLAILLNPSVAA
jgi:putative Ca2+/H+ antiporter (TMEM165/GDT1 family)